MLVPAAAARVLPSLLRFAVLFSLPIALSALLVNLFFYPGAQTVLFRLGPITATQEGLSFAIEILCRIAAISGAVTLFYLTTKPSELVLDLERRGVPARLAFVANASVQTVPAMAERAQAIIAAQRARGLDTEGSVWKRIKAQRRHGRRFAESRRQAGEFREIYPDAERQGPRPRFARAVDLALGTTPQGGDAGRHRRGWNSLPTRQKRSPARTANRDCVQQSRQRHGLDQMVVESRLARAAAIRRLAIAREAMKRDSG